MEPPARHPDNRLDLSRVAQGERREKSCGRTRHLHHGIAGKIRSAACTPPLYCLFVARRLPTQSQTLRQERGTKRKCVCDAYEFGPRPDHHISLTDTYSHCPPVFSSTFTSTTSPRCAVPVERVFFFCGGASSVSSLSATPIRAMQLADWSCSTRRVGRANTPNKPSHVMLHYSTSSCQSS